MKIKYLNNIVFLLAISTIMTALPDLIIPIFIPYKEFIITPIIEVLFILFLINKYKSLNFCLNKSEMFLYFFAIAPIFIMYLSEPFRSMYLKGREPLYILVNFFSILIFFIYYVLNVAKDKNFFMKSLKIYWKFNYIIVILAILVFVLLKFGFLNIYFWKLPYFFSEHFKIKFNIPGATENLYSVPFFVTVIITSYIKPIPFFGEFGTFCGLSYEPHIATYFMTPAFFLTFYFYKANYRNILIYYIPFVIFFILAGSVTNLIALLITAIIFILLNFKRIFLKLLFFLLLLLAIIYLYKNQIIFIYDILSKYIIYKIDSRSNEETMGFISYILSPKTFLGWGAFNIPLYGSRLKINDIGLFSSFFIILLYFQLLFYSFLNILYKNYVFAAIGIYIFIHSMKFPLHVLQLPYFVFIIIIIVHFATNKHKYSYKGV